MKIRQLNPGFCRTYLAVSGKNEAILIDPLLDRVEEYLKLIETERLHIVGVTDTHTHADHLSGSPLLAGALNVPYAMHRNSVQRCVTQKVNDGDTMKIGESSLKFLHTPGHTNDSLTLLIDENVLTGDFLFIGTAGAGRTDLPTGDAGEHFDSLQKLSRLADSSIIYPAHEYHGNISSTMADERKKNPTLRFVSKSDYLKWISALPLQPAPWMLEVIRANQSCGHDAEHVHIPSDQAACEVQALTETADEPEFITAEILMQRLAGKGDVVIIDVRNDDEFTGELGHINGAIRISLADLPNKLTEVKRLNSKDIVTVCNAGARSKTAVEILKKAGVENVSCLTGGMKRWNDLKFPVVR